MKSPKCRRIGPITLRFFPELNIKCRSYLNNVLDNPFRIKRTCSLYSVLLPHFKLTNFSDCVIISQSNFRTEMQSRVQCPPTSSSTPPTTQWVSFFNQAFIKKYINIWGSYCTMGWEIFMSKSINNSPWPPCQIIFMIK